jgi:hypothetical protein
MRIFPPLAGPDRAQGACRRKGNIADLGNKSWTKSTLARIVVHNLGYARNNWVCWGLVPYRVVVERGGVLLRAVQLRKQGVLAVREKLKLLVQQQRRIQG